MKTPLDISDSEIIRIVSNTFHKNFMELEFIPVGEASWLYRAKEQNGELFVIKIQRGVQAAPSEVLAQLTENKYRWVPESILTSNSMLWMEDNGYYYSVQKYVHSEILYHAASEPNERFLHELGTALAELHTLLFDKAKLPNVSVENFHPDVFAIAKSAIDKLRSDTSDNIYIEKVKRVFEKQSSNIEQLFINTLTYGEALANNSPSMLVVHGDMHFGNVLKPDSEQLYLIDWDHTQYALPEMDLMYLTDKQINVLSETYGRNLLENRVAIQYYRNFLLIRAIEFFLGMLLSPNHFGDENTADSVVEIFDMSPYMQRAIIEN